MRSNRYKIRLTAMLKNLSTCDLTIEWDLELELNKGSTRYTWRSFKDMNNNQQNNKILIVNCVTLK